MFAPLSHPLFRSCDLPPTTTRNDTGRLGHSDLLLTYTTPLGIIILHIAILFTSIWWR